MPYELNGTYYTIEEIARPLGRTYSIVLRWIRRMGLTPLVVARTMLLNEEEKQAVYDFADAMENYNRYPPIKEAAKKKILNVPYKELEKYVVEGKIPSVRDTLGKYRLTHETIYIIQKSELGQGSKTDWGNIIKLFEEEEV